jgi:hypothetical protein
MSFNVDLMESINIVPAWVPGTDINSDAAGDWVSLKHYDGCLVVFHKAAGTAGDDPSVVLNQATDVSGTGSKALNFNHIYHKIGATALSAVGTFTKVELATETADLDLVSVNSVDLLTDVGETIIVVNVRATDLDVDNSFDCLQFTVEGDDVANATLSAAYYILYNCRYPGPTPPSAIVD